jgi:hypothetical protein
MQIVDREAVIMDTVELPASGSRISAVVVQYLQS